MGIRIGAWLLLAAASLGLTWLLTRAAVPAAILLGPLVCGIAFGTGNAGLRVHRHVFICAQGVVGCLIAQSVTIGVLRDIAAEWPAMLFAVAATLLSSTTVGWLLARYGSLPGSTAAWGASPGGASAMVAMAQEFGADIRIVALMQYLRVLCVVFTASVVTRWLVGAGESPAEPAAAAGGPLALGPLLVTIALAFGGASLAARLRLPAGGILVPLALGALLNGSGLLRLELPWWLLSAAYAAIGWYIGLQFERRTITSSVRAIPAILGASFGVIALCAVSSWLLARFEGMDPLTAFLATSPGGIDSIAIMAVDGGADTAFVMALQTLRVLVVIATGPAIAKFIARTAVPGGLNRPSSRRRA